LRAVEADQIADDLGLIRNAARDAGEIALGFFKQSPEVWMKGGTSPVSEADYAVDRFLRETLTAARPTYGWLSEETADSAGRLAASRTFVVDPIDGTRAFLDGRSTWCISIGVVEGGRPLAGVLDCPATGEIFWAGAGSGAWKDGGRLAVGAPREPALIGGPKPLLDAAQPYLPCAVQRAQYVPSLAYRIAMVAEGVLDATFIKPSSHDWDLAAADLILAEAGGQLLEPSGARPVFATADPRHGALAAGSGPLLQAMVAAIASIEIGIA
jgi:myo-inositol-1(or 4)-monophosphatase